MSPPLHQERVLSTLEADGKRRWLDPRLSRGRFLSRRRIVGYSLIALFVALPFVRIGGRPAFLIDLVTREVSLFGAVFRPTDGFVLMMLGLSIALGVFLVTALFGRVWCGYGCPQSVYLELVFRPIERKLRGHRVVKWIVFAALSFLLANVFLSYFVGTERLRHWVLESPLEHLGGFSVVSVVSALVLFDFGYFREQACILACPYGRLQSVLLDRQSLVVGYDARRGEPRGKSKKKLPVLQDRGDCIDCGACVTTCPTGIDIRDGLQMECIGCAQCIDACDHVMDKIGKPRGLIGYTSQERLEGKPGRLLRVRTIVYPALLVLTASLLVWSAASRDAAVVWVERHQGASFVMIDDATVTSQMRLKIENREHDARVYTVEILDGLALRGQARWEIKAHGAQELPLFVDVPRNGFVHGKRKVRVRIATEGFSKIVDVTLLGPNGGS